MAEKGDQKELENIKELLVANSMQTDAVAQLLIEKGIITEQELLLKLKQVVFDHKTKQGHDN